MSAPAPLGLTFREPPPWPPRPRSAPARSPAGRTAPARAGRGPRRKAVVSRNALKHGLTARGTVLLEGEDAAMFAEFQAALRAELAPEGLLQ